MGVSKVCNADVLMASLAVVTGISPFLLSSVPLVSSVVSSTLLVVSMAAVSSPDSQILVSVTQPVAVLTDGLSSILDTSFSLLLPSRLALREATWPCFPMPAAERALRDLLVS